MTKKSDLKTMIRARCAKTGESYVEARRQLLAKAGPLCPACGGLLTRSIVRPMTEMPDLDDDATDGQAADWLAAHESGDYGEWVTDIVEIVCARCDAPDTATPGASDAPARGRRSRRPR